MGAGGSHRVHDHTVLLIPENTVWIEVDGEVVAWQQQQRAAHTLTGPSAAVFAMLDGIATLGDVAHAVAQAHAVDPARARAHVLQFADDLARHRLVTVAGQQR